MSPRELSNSTIVDPEDCNTAEKKDKDLKMAFMNMIEVLKEKMNNLGCYEKTKYKNNNRGRRQDPSQRHRKYIQQNHWKKNSLT